MMAANTKRIQPKPVNYSSNLGMTEGWASPMIRDILTVNYGKGLIKSKRMSGSIPVYGSNGAVGEHNEAFTQGPTIIIGRKGTVGAINFSDVPCWPIDTTYFIDEFNDLDSKYVGYALKSLNLVELDTSTAIPGLNRDDLYGQHIPLAPLSEQKRIVEKVEELLVRVNAARERLAKVQKILKRFRQSVLASACSGDLTSDWRRENQDIKSAKKHMEDLIKIQKNAVKTRDSAFDLKTLREKLRYLEKDPRPFSNDKNIPDKWLLTSFYNLCILQRGYDLPTKRRIAGQFPIISSGGISGFNNEYKVKSPCVCVGRSGSVGKTYYFDSDAWPLNTSLFVKEFNGNHPKFVFYYLTNMGLEKFSSSTAVPTLNRNTFTFEKVFIPPIEEQKAIACRVEALFKIADQIEERYQKAKTCVDELKHSVLAKAFRGELVPTEAELTRQEGRPYEPASALLAKIKAKRKDVKPHRKRGGTLQRRSNKPVLTS